MATRKELISVVRARYQACGKSEKGAILDEFVAVTGYHRKHVLRLMNQNSNPTMKPRGARRIYREAEKRVLVVLWEAADRICGKRLKALIPTLLEAMEYHGHLAVAPPVRDRLLQMSASTIDRALVDVRSVGNSGRRRRSSLNTIRRQVPVRTFQD